MRRTVHKISILLMAVLAIGLGISFAKADSRLSEVKAAPAVYQKPDNSQCLSCHSAPDQVHQFPNGDTVSISVDAQAFDQGVHNELACQVCHTNIAGFPHPQNSASSAREYTLQYKDTCNQCHKDQAQDIKGSAHTKLAEAGNPNTPLCVDCHHPHATAPIEKDENGDPAPSEYVKIAETCAVCHSQVVEQYKTSVHGAGVFETFNPDVPACHDCHGIHKIATVRTNQFRLDSPQLCAKCHTDSSIMDKYGLSTQVLNTYVSDFHGTTVTLFDRKDPEMPINVPVCYDCHGIHDIASASDPEKGIQIKENMLVVCQNCHPDASENFSDSWMSHYIPHPQKTPLVYYVQLFYQIFIPGVLGGMAVFVVVDIFGKIRRRGKPEIKHEEGKE